MVIHVNQLFGYFMIGLIFKYLQKSAYSCDLLYSDRVICRLICHFKIVRQCMYIVRRFLRSRPYFFFSSELKSELKVKSGA